MSDIYNPLQQASNNAQGYLDKLNGTNPLQEASNQIEKVQKALDVQKESHPDLPPMASWDYDLYDRVLPAVEASSDPMATREKLNAAMLYSKLFEKPITETYANLNAYNEAWLGKGFVPKTDTKAITDSLKLGLATIDYSILGSALKAAGGEDENIKADIANKLKEINQLQDNVPRPWYIDALKYGAQSLPYTGIAAGVGLATGGLGASFLAGSSLSAEMSGMIIAGSSTLASGTASYGMMEGSEYLDLRAAGVRHDIAAPASTISALIQSAIEVGLGNVPGALNKIGSTGIENVTSSVLKKLFVSGKMGSFAKAASGYVGEAFEEGAEELLQSLTSSTTLNISAALQKEGVTTQDADTIANTAIQNFNRGFLGSLVLGIPSTMFDYHGDIKEAKRVAEMARTFDEPTFIAKAGESELFKGLSEEDKKSALKKTYDAQQKRTGKENKSEVKSADQGAPTVATPGPARRNEDGTLYVQALSEGTGKDVVEEATLKIGDPKTGDNYGNIKYRIDGDNVIIDNVSIAQFLTDKSEVAHDAIVELGAQHPGMNIEFNPTDPELQAIKDRVVSENPRGKESGVQWFDVGSNQAETRKAVVVGKAIRESFKNLSDQDVHAATTMVYESARSLGFRPEDVIGKSLSLISKEDLTPDLSAQIDQARLGEMAAKMAASGQTERGATLFLKDGQISGINTATKEFERGMKAVIYAAKNADLSTFSHEWFHFIDVAYISRSQKHRQLFEEAMGKRYDEFTIEDREKLAYSYEKYLKDGKAPTEGLKVLFQRMAKAMAKVISTFGSSMEISTELRKAYDSLFQGNDQLSEDAQTEAIEAAPSEKKPSLTDMYDDLREALGLFQHKGHDVSDIVFSFPPELSAYTDIHSQSQLPSFMNVFGRGVSAGREIRLGDVGSSHVQLSNGLNDPKRFYFGYSKENESVYVVPKNSIDNSYFRRPEILKTLLSNIFDKYKLSVKQGERLSFKDKPDILFQFAGEKAYLDDEEKKNLVIAKQMDESGKDNESIRIATGWFRGKHDRKWRLDGGWKPTKINQTAMALDTPPAGDIEVSGYVKELYHGDSELSRSAHTATVQEPGRYKILFQHEIPFEQNEARAIIEMEKPIPEGWYVHGRNRTKKFANNSWPTQFTRDIETANSYASGGGEVWMARPSKDATIADFHSETSEDMDNFIDGLKAIYEGRDEYGLPEEIEQVVNDIASSEGIDPEDLDFNDFEEQVRINFAPEKIVDTAGAYDSDWINLLSYYGGTDGSWPDWVFTPDGAVLIPGSEALESVNLTRVAEEDAILFQAAPPTDSEAFKEWFGDSKVVDEEGKPLVVYHGTTKDFEFFDEKKSSRTDRATSRFLGFFFTDDPNDADRYAKWNGANGKKLDVYLSIKKPFLWEFRDHDEFNMGVYNRMRDNGFKFNDEDIKKWESEARKNAKKMKADLIAKGYDGIFIMGNDGTVREYIAFSPTQIKSVNNRGTWDASDPRILFQLTDQEIDTEAQQYDSWEAWKKDVESSYDFLGPDYSAKPDLTGKEADAWYKARWEQVKGIVKNTDPATDIFNKTTEELDQEYIDKMKQDGNLEKYLEDLQYSRQENNAQPADQEEALVMEEADQLRNTINRSVHPTILNNAQRIMAGRKITPKARKAILSLMADGARLYRELYVSITGDQSLASEGAVETMPEIKDTESRPLSIVDRMNLARSIKNKKVQQDIMAGNIVPEDVRGLIKQLEKEKSDITHKLNEAQKEINEDREHFLLSEKSYIRLQEKYKSLQSEIKKNETELNNTRKNLEKIRAREKQGAKDSTIIREWKIAEGKHKVEKKVLTEKERREKLRLLYTEKIQKLSDTISDQKAELKDIKSSTKESMASARAEASLQKQKAVDDMVKKIKQKEEQRRELAKVLNYKRKIVAQIMAKPSDSVWYEQREKIRAIQKAIDPHIRSAVVKWNGERYDINEFREKAVNENIIDILPKSLVQRLFKKSVDEWSVSELEQMRDEIEHLKDLGRSIWGQKEMVRLRDQKIDRQEVINQHASMNPGNAAAAGSKERKEQLNKLNRPWVKIATVSWTLSRIADWLDGGKHGIHTKLLVDEERDSYNTKMDNIDKRVNRIQKIMKDKGVEVRGLYEKEHTIQGVGPGNTDVTFTTSDLMYLRIGLRDQNTKAAILYGNLMDQSERSTWDNETLKIMARDKVRALEQSIDKELTENEKFVADEISNDFRDEFGRLNDIFLNEFNIAMKQVDSYVPMIRQDITASGEQHEEQQAQEILNVAGVSVKRTPEKGFTVNRIRINPRNQRAIKLDLYGTWMDAVERQEHFAAYTRYIRKLNGIYKNTQNSESRLLRHFITQTYGSEALKRVDTEINRLANPQSFRDDRNIDKMVRILRGNLGAAYLAWKTSSILKQLVSSPAPYLAYVNPLDFSSSAFEFMQNPKSMTEEIKSKSAIMRHRVSSPIYEALKKAQEDNKGKKGLSTIQNIGMKGLELADWVSVATGWNAVYKKALLEGSTEKEAIAKADDITLKCQPSAREQDLSPLFKTNSEAFKLITQFQTALNVIWNQFTYDLPTAVKNRQWGFVVSMTSAYALAGIGLGMMTQGLGGDNKDEKWYKRFMYWSMSQAFDSVPLIGSGVSALAQQAITGERRQFYASSMFPAADQMINAAGSMSSGDWEKAAEGFATGIGIGLGLPTSGIKEAISVPENPGRLIGRR